MLRRPWLMLLLVCLGCQSPVNLDVAPLPDPTPTQETPNPSAQAKELWEMGQSAMKEGQPQKAIDLFQQSLALDPSMTCNFLSLGAAHLEAGQQEKAALYLARYVALHPEHLSVRTLYAELLLRLHQDQEARCQLERFIADAQDAGAEQESPIIHSHSRLMEIAEADEDPYEAHLNRGIGLYLLARRRADVDDPDGELPADGLLWKAAQELSLAQSLRPREARPCWYLYSVWHGLARQQLARRWLRLSLENAPFSNLTPAEQRGLYQAGQNMEKPL
jgi:tetratricopeptide (TPR) repeat protein